MKKLSTAIAALLLIAINSNAQNVGIGTTTPVTRLHVADSSVLFSGPTALPATAGLPPVSGIGNRMMWYSNKAAFRAGGTANTSWDDTYIGKYSTAFGLSNKAAGMYSTSMGWGNSSSGLASFSTGYSNTSVGTYSAAFGEQVDAQSYASLVIGRYNLQSGNSTSWINTDPLFVVGTGYTYEVSPGIGAIQRRNGFIIDKSGNTTINGKATINNSLEVNGSASITDSLTVSNKIKVLNSISIGDFGKLTSLHVGGGVSLKESIVEFDPRNGGANIIVGNKSYIKIGVGAFSGNPPYNVILSDGVTRGQILIIAGYLFGDSFNFKDNIANNLALSSDRVVNDYRDKLGLMWTGFAWEELFFSNNH